MPTCSRLLALAALIVSPSLWAAPYAYIANTGGSSVSVVDTATDAVVQTISVGAYPTGVAVGPGGDRVYVSNYSDNSVSVIDGATQSVIKTIAVGGGPVGVAVSDDGKHVLVASVNASSVTLIDAEALSVVGTQTVNLMPRLVAFAGEGGGFVPGKGHFLVAGQGNKIIEVGRNLAVGPTHVYGYEPGGILTQGANVFVSDMPGAVSRIYTDETGWYAPDTYKFNGLGAGLAYTVNRSVPSSPFGMVLVTSTNSDMLWMISTRVSPLQALAAIKVGRKPTDVAVTPVGDKAYVVNYEDDTVSVIDIYSQEVVDVIAVGPRPNALGQFIRPAADHVPAPYAFSPVNNALISSGLLRANVLTSNSVVLTGYDSATPVSITCPSGDAACGFSINGGEWTKGSASMSPGSSVRVRVKASTQPGTTTKAVLDAGGRRAEFAVTTQFKRSLIGG